jgi:hypothetical protein
LEEQNETTECWAAGCGCYDTYSTSKGIVLGFRKVKNNTYEEVMHIFEEKI